jgi:pseudouridine synthase
MISSKRISINGEVVSEQGMKIDPDKDTVSVDGKEIVSKDTLVYYWLNKPVGVISAASSKYGEETVADLIKSDKRIYPVGRLDKDSQGLILLTNDGELTHRLTHPKYHIDKTYKVKVVGTVSDVKLEKLRTGIQLDEGMTAPAEVEVLDEEMHGGTLEFTIHEGKHRQIRRMCAYVHLHVVELTRVNFGPIKLGNLAIGEHKPLTTDEVTTLKSIAGLF